LKFKEHCSGPRLSCENSKAPFSFLAFSERGHEKAFREYPQQLGVEFSGFLVFFFYP
jgi:hypothetical protein